MEHINPTKSYRNSQFTPTPLMIVWVDVVRKTGSKSPTIVVAFCEALWGLKTSRQSWYDWQKLKGFEQWFYEACLIG